MDDSPGNLAPADPAFPGDDPGKRLARAERVLATVQQALNHDLPNLLVAIQGLLQVVELEEAERLSASGQDCLRRAAASTRRVHETLTMLRALGRAAAEAGPAEEVALAELAREAAAEVRQLFPGRTVTYHLRLQVSAVRVPRRSMQRAVVELTRIVLGESDAPGCHLQLDSRHTPGGIELLFGPVAEGGGQEPGPHPPAAARLGVALVREVADTWGGTLTQSEGPGPAPRFVLRVPSGPGR
jgi:hypothetical protein